jgi:hypothetical protein
MQSIVGRVDNIVPALKGWRGASGVMTGGVSHFCRSDWERRRNFGAVGSNHDVAPTRGMTSLKLEARQDPLAAALNGNCSYGCSATRCALCASAVAGPFCYLDVFLELALRLGRRSDHGAHGPTRRAISPTQDAVQSNAGRHAQSGESHFSQPHMRCIWRAPGFRSRLLPQKKSTDRSISSRRSDCASLV